MHHRTHQALILVAIFFLFIIGCGGDDDPVTPDPISVGTIVINPTPDILNAPWVLTGPDGYSKSSDGDQSLTGLSVGEYTLVWGDVVDYVTPPESTQTLADDGTITFNGVYSDDPDPIPDYVLIPPVSVSMPTTFTMGSAVAGNETPHQVTLTGRFNMASTEVTNAQYVSALQWAFNQGHVTATSLSVQDNLDGSTAELLDLDDSDCQISFSEGVFSTPTPDRPVVMVSWYGSVVYCDWLSLQEGLPRAYDHSTWSCNSGYPYSASGYRLPTEAEWEFACRAGTATEFNTGDCLDAATEANFNGDFPYTDCLSGPSLGRTADVGSYSANQWGLFDIHGNVWEWCNDWYGTSSVNVTDPEGAVYGDYRVLRGGGWNYSATYCRSAVRYNDDPNNAYYFYGFRPVRSTQ